MPFRGHILIKIVEIFRNSELFIVYHISKRLFTVSLSNIYVLTYSLFYYVFPIFCCDSNRFQESKVFIDNENEIDNWSCFDHQCLHIVDSTSCRHY